MQAIGYIWALPVTVVGLVFALFAAITGGAVGFRNGVVEVYGGVLNRLLRGSTIGAGGAAMTLGHVILARNAQCLESSREHELAHVRQFQRWGPLLLPLYWGIGFWLRVRGYDPYLDNPFEPPPR